MYAVIEDSGTQFKVAEGDVLEVDLRELPEGTKQIQFDRVLLVGGEQVKVGAPLVAGAKVLAEIVNEEFKDVKVITQRIRRRKASRRKIGHRQKYMQVRITKIEA